MKWDIDKALKSLDGRPTAGTYIQRVIMDVENMVKNNLKPKPEHMDRGYGQVWCLTVGLVHERKSFYYGHTIRQAYLQARRGQKA